MQPYVCTLRTNDKRCVSTQGVVWIERQTVATLQCLRNNLNSSMSAAWDEKRNVQFKEPKEEKVSSTLILTTPTLIPLALALKDKIQSARDWGVTKGVNKSAHLRVVFFKGLIFSEFTCQLGINLKSKAKPWCGFNFSLQWPKLKGSEGLQGPLIPQSCG